MYKDVWKRILALVLAVCLIGTAIQWPETVMAAEVKDYHTYQHGSGSTSGWVETNVAAAVFTVGQNSSGGAEILDSVSFHAHINEDGKDTKATVSYYINPQGTPDSGTFVHAKTISNLKEGQNTVEAGMESRELAAGTKFAVVVSLEGASLGYYNAGGAGQTYISVNGSWKDASESGQCVAIRAYTYDVGDDGEDGIIEQITSFFSDDDSITQYDASTTASSNAQLNKTNMVVPKDEIGNITLNDASGSVKWSVDDPTIAQIEEWGDSSALVKGLASGETTIRAVDAGVTYTCTLKVTSSVEDAEITLTPESVVYDGSRHLPIGEVTIGETKLTENEDYQINCVSVEVVDGQEVEGAAVSLNDANAFINAGTYRFTIVGQEPYSGKKTIDYVIEPKQITDQTIEVALNAWDATQPLNYVASVTDTTRSTALTLDATTGDYYLEEATNDAGEAGINIIGRGNYTGTRFCTTPKSVAGAQITFDLSAYVYLGREWQPTISVAVDGVVLSQADYTVAYSNNTDAGTATVTVTGQNGYYGTTSADFTILQKDISNADSDLIQSPVEATVANAVGNADPDVVVTYNGKTLTENTDYTVTFSSDVDAGTGTCTITGTGKNYKGSRTEDYTVVTGDISAYTIEVADVTYTGEALTPAVVLKDSAGDTPLLEGVDYSVSYANNVNVGTATVTVRGIGAFGGKKTATFAIKQADLSTFSYRYQDATGNAVSTSNYKVDYSLNVDDMKPQVVVKDTQGKILTEGKEYKLTYSVEGKDATADVLTGQQTITVEALDTTNYTNSKQLIYTIQKCNLQTAIDSGKITLKLDKEAFDYTGTAQKPVPTLSYATGEVLEAGRDYTIEYSTTEPIEAGEYKVMITGQGNYMGYVDKAFKITKIDIQTLENIEPDENQVGYVTDYNGTWFAMKWYDDSSKANNELELIIKDNDNKFTLVEGTDYELSYENINQVSDSSTFAKVTITGRGTYTGERVIYYLLAGKLEDYTLSIKDEDLVYTGEEITLKKDNVTVKTGYLWWKDVLEQGVDYQIKYEDNINAGDAKIVIEPIDDDKMPTVNGCYRYSENIADDDKLHGTFIIDRKDISDQDTIELTSAIVKQYDGKKPVELDTTDIPLTYNGMDLTDQDFEIVANSHVNNDSPSNNASVTINGIGNYTGTRVIPFVIKGKSLDNLKAVLDPDPVTYTGEALYPEITSLEAEDGTALTKDKDYEYDRSDYSDNVDAGKGTITVHGLGEYLGSTGEVKFTIEPRNINDTTAGTCTVEGVEPSGYTYTSQPIKPEVDVKYQVTGLGTRILKAGTDYTVDYSDNVNASDTTTKAAVVITGTGNYTGTVNKEFAILAKDITDADITIAPIDSQEYNGGIAVTPIPDISYNYGSADTDVYRLVSDDYTLTYQGQNKVGKATITITGKGNFTGETTVTYHIGSSITDTNKVSISCPEVESGASYVYKGSAYKPAVKVTNLTTGASLELGKDYTVKYVNNEDVGTATITVQGIGSYAGKKEYNFTITPKNLADSDVALSIENVTDGSYQAAYTGSAIEPEVTLTYNGMTIDTGYSVNYGVDNTNIGFVNVTVTALANTNYTGTKDIQNTSAAKFEIVPASIGNGGSAPAAGFTMEAIEPQPLGTNGTATPTPKLYHNGTALVAGFDYTYSYEKNNAIGTDAVVILKGIGNYTGSVRQKFEICGSIEGATVEVTEEIWYKDCVDANGGVAPDEIKFDDAIKVTVNGVELTKDTDYELFYANNTWVGMATVTVKGIGAYAGIVKTEVPIRADLSEATVTVGEQKYTGSPVKAVPIVEYYGKALIEGTHFIIHTYSNNTNLTDNASVTIIGNEKNGFYGTRTESFSITADAEALTVSGVEESYMYRGTAIEPSVTVKLGNTTLKASEYEVTYGTNTNVGYGTIVVKGKGSYEGFAAKSILFDIVAQDINSLTILDGNSNVFADREYTGMAILPDVALTAKVGTQTFTLPTSDYTVTATTDNVSVGTVTLEITGTGNVTGSRQVTFDIVPKSLSKPASGTQDNIAVQVTQDTYTYDGTAKTPSVIVTYQYGTETQVRTLEQDKDYTVSYSDNVAVGTASVTVSGIGNYAGSRTANFTIKAQDMSAATVTLPNGTIYPYMGTTVGVEPEVVVTLKGITLTKDKDYTVAYQNNKACGTALVTVSGKGDFTGSVTANFTIETHSINAADVVVESIPNQAYTGSPIIPEVKITCGTYKLVKGVDYELAGIANTQMGQAAVTITGINGFKDSRMEAFVIASSIEQAEVTGLKDSYEYIGQPFTAETLGITEVRIGDTILSTSDYTIGFADGYDGTSAGKQKILLIGTGNYGGNKEYEITITPKNITDDDIVMMGFLDSLPYAEKLTQNITLIWGTTTLQNGTDYEVECNPTDTAGIYKMTVAGKGNYAGVIERSFKVEQTNLADAEITGISSNYTYTGDAIEPKPVVKLGGAELKEGVDYTLTYLDNVNVGVATMKITSTGTNYLGEKEVTFTILRRSINHATFGEIETQIYIGKDIKPEVIVKDNGKTLVENTDYTLMYKNNLKTGTASVVVAGKGNYTSTKTIPFAIRPCNVETIATTGVSSTTVSLSWKSEGVITGYEIYRMSEGGKWQLVGGTKGTTYTDAKLSANTSYSYKIRSYVVEESETYYGEFSPVVNAVTSK